MNLKFETCPVCGEQKGSAFYMMKLYAEDVAFLLRQRWRMLLYGLLLGLFLSAGVRP